MPLSYFCLIGTAPGLFVEKKAVGDVMTFDEFGVRNHAVDNAVDAVCLDSFASMPICNAIMPKLYAEGAGGADKPGLDAGGVQPLLHADGAAQRSAAAGGSMATKTLPEGMPSGGVQGGAGGGVQAPGPADAAGMMLPPMLPSNLTTMIDLEPHMNPVESAFVATLSASMCQGMIKDCLQGQVNHVGKCFDQLRLCQQQNACSPKDFRAREINMCMALAIKRASVCQPTTNYMTGRTTDRTGKACEYDGCDDCTCGPPTGFLFQKLVYSSGLVCNPPRMKELNGVESFTAVADGSGGAGERSAGVADGSAQKSALDVSVGYGHTASALSPRAVSL